MIDAARAQPAVTLDTNDNLCLDACVVFSLQLPRVELIEMGPRLDLTVRRRRDAPPDLAKEAHKQPKLTGKKVRALQAKSMPASSSFSVWGTVRTPPLALFHGAITG